MTIGECTYSTNNMNEIEAYGIVRKYMQMWQSKNINFIE